MKIDKSFIIKRYKNKKRLESYVLKAKEGLWKEEEILVKKYLNKKDKVLIVGCGTGREIIGLKKLGFNNLVGVDISPDMIREAKKLLPDVKLITSNIIEFKPTRKYDAILYFNNIIEQIPNKKDRVKAILKPKQLLNKKGKIILTSHSCFVHKNFLELIKSFILYILFRLKINKKNPFEYINKEEFIYANYSNPFRIKNLLIKNNFLINEINSKKFILKNKKPGIRYIFSEPIYYVARLK